MNIYQFIWMYEQISIYLLSSFWRNTVYIQQNKWDAASLNSAILTWIDGVLKKLKSLNFCSSLRKTYFINFLTTDIFQIHDN